MTAVGLGLVGLAVLFVWAAVRNLNPLDELRRTLGLRAEASRPLTGSAAGSTGSPRPTPSVGAAGTGGGGGGRSW